MCHVNWFGIVATADSISDEVLVARDNIGLIEILVMVNPILMAMNKLSSNYIQLYEEPLWLIES